MNMDDEDYIDVNLMDIYRMKVSDLKRELKARGLSASGPKQELIDRLASILENSKETENSPNSAASDVEDESSIIDEDQVLNDDEIDEEDDEDDEQETMSLSNIDLDIIDTPAVKTRKIEKRKCFIDDEDIVDDENQCSFSENIKENKPPAGKKIILNRNFSPPEPSSSQEDNTARNDAANKANSSKEKMATIKMSKISVKQRLEMRTKKFGVPLSEEAKKVARVMRFCDNQANEKIKLVSLDNLTNEERLKKRAERFGLMSLAQDDKKSKRLDRFKTNKTT